MAGGWQGIALGICHIGERLAFGSDHGRIMELMPAERLTGGGEAGIVSQGRATIAQGHAAPRHASLDRQQSGHGVGDPLGVLKRAAEYHVPTALAMDWPGVGEQAQPVEEAPVGSEPRRVELGIATREPARIALAWRWFVAEW